MERIRSVGVVGAGIMGMGITHVCAVNGFDVVLYDVNAQQVKNACDAIEASLAAGVAKGKITHESMKTALSRIVTASDLAQVTANLIIEAAVERLDVKKELFSKLEEFNLGKAILASNTSSISIKSIAGALREPGDCLGLHFFNPADRMKLVEIISTNVTKEHHVERVRQFAGEIGKTAVMAKDSPGFIVNRVARHYYVESLKLLEEEAADVKGMDALLRASGFKMGPFELMDLIGLDTNLAVTTSVFEGFGKASKFAPSRIQQKLVSDGQLGRKSGKGFYAYTQQSN